jgi:hypothetical protein
MAFADEIAQFGCRVVLLVPAGSDLATELLARTLGPEPRIPELRLVDATNAAQIQAVENGVDLQETLFVVDEPTVLLTPAARQFVVVPPLEQEAA